MLGQAPPQGKGAPDGVGGSLKRAADMRILHGGTIENASSFIRELRETDSSVILYEVSQEVASRQKQRGRLWNFITR